MKLDLKEAWSVRIDVEVQYQGSGRPYRKHINVIVYAPTIERALAVVRSDYPDSTVWAANHAHKDAVILVEHMPLALITTEAQRIAHEKGDDK